MSSDPKRFLDRKDTGERARRLLQAGSELQPPAELRAVLWATIASQLPPVGAPPSADGGPQNLPFDPAPPTAPPAPVLPSTGAPLASKTTAGIAKTVALKAAPWLPTMAAFKPFLAGVVTTATAIGVYHSSSPAPGNAPTAVAISTVRPVPPAWGTNEARSRGDESARLDDERGPSTAAAIETGSGPDDPAASAPKDEPPAASALATSAVAVSASSLGPSAVASLFGATPPPARALVSPSWSRSMPAAEGARPASADTPRLAAPAQPETRPDAPLETASEATPETAAATASPSASGAPSPSPSASAAPTSPLLAESRALAEARAALRAGDGARALARLDAVRTRFGASALEQEWRVLRIEALWSLGRRGEAAGESDAFLREYPASAHAARVLTFRGGR